MVLLLPACTQTSKALVDYVDPNIGTAHCRWFFYTPETRENWQNPQWRYDENHTQIGRASCRERVYLCV